MNTDKIKEFFIAHVEKIGVAVVVAFAGWLVYSGLQLEEYTADPTKQPELLTENANEVRRSIQEDDHSEEVVQERVQTVESTDIVKRTAELTAGVDPGRYELSNPWEIKKVDEAGAKRLDPELLAARDLHMVGFLGTMAVPSRDGGIYSLQDLEAAPALERAEAKPKRKSRAEKRAERMGGGGGEYGEEEGGGYGEEEGGGYGDEEGYGDESMSAASAVRQLSDDDDYGAQVRSPTDLNGSPITPEPGPAVFIAGTAVVPYAELYEKYGEALKGMADYDARRDIPKFLDMEVQRADVTGRSVADIQEKDWVAIGNTESFIRRAAMAWAGVAQEIVDEEYRDEMLTMAIPPVLLDDYRPFSLHPQIPTVYEEPVVEASAPAITFDELDGEEQDYEAEMEGSYEQSFSPTASMAVETPQVPYRLIRFFDFPSRSNKLSLNRQYSYRVRFAVEDPNFPQLASDDPPSKSLSPDVYARVRAKREEAIKTKKRDAKLWSDWSEPSARANLPGFQDYVVGPVVAGRSVKVKVGNRVIPKPTKPLAAKVVASYFDASLLARVQSWFDIQAGSVLSDSGDLEVVDPISKEVKLKPEAVIKGASTVIDLDGGQKLDISDDDNMTEPGLFLIWDEAGGLKVASEIEEQELYRAKSFADERGL